MATTPPAKARCIICDKERSAVRCEGCLQIFCYNHLSDHRQDLNKQLDEIETNRDIFRQALTQQTTDSKNDLLLKQIDDWKCDSFREIEQIAEECKKRLVQYTTDHISQRETDLAKLTDQLRYIRQENDFNELDLNELREKLTQLEQQLDQPLSISIQRDSSLPINQISVVISSSKFVFLHILEKDKYLVKNVQQKPHVDNELVSKEY